MPAPLKGLEAQSDTLITPDAFWKLIEKLLLHSTSDESARARHNLSLSALCKGQALPPLPRQHTNKSQKSEYRKKSNLNDEEKNGTAYPDNCKRDSRSVVVSPLKNDLVQKTKETRNEELEEKPKTVEDKNRNGETDCQNLSKTKSECSLRDLRKQLIKDKNVPASERLWRYAMRNKKVTSEKVIKEAESTPSARSNEAIFKGLQTRLNEAEKEMNAKEKTKVKCKPIKTAQKVQEMRQNRLKSQAWLDEIRKSGHRNETTSSVTPSLFTKSNCSENAEVMKPAEKFRNDDTLELKSWPILKQQNVEERKALYDGLMKKRFTCGCQLESLNKELMGKGNPRSVLNSDVAKKYSKLKSEYLKLCYQESNLRHQIALLHSEIYMMQTKAYHKVPAAVKTITLESKTKPMVAKSSVSYVEHNPRPTGDAPYFPPLKPPRPLFQSRSVPDRCFTERVDKPEPKLFPDQSLPELPDRKLSQTSVCSFYSLSPMVTPPPKHDPTPIKAFKEKEEERLIKLIHRLPKLKSTES